MPYLHEHHEVRVTRDVPYARARVHVSTTPIERTLHLDVYEPVEPGAAATRPALIMAFGGAFHRGNKEADEFEGDPGHRNTPVSAWCHAFARRGYCAFSIDYRLTQEDPDPGTTPVVSDANEVPRSRVDYVRGLLGLGPSTPEMMRDAIEAACDDLGAAFDFVRSQADRFRVDPARIAIGGFSAGARMALYTAYVQRVPAAAVLALSGYMTLRDLQTHVTRARPLPPVCLVSGENDLDYLAKQAPLMADHFVAAREDCEWWQVPGGTHFYPADSEAISRSGERDRLESAVARFLARALVREPS